MLAEYRAAACPLAEASTHEPDTDWYCAEHQPQPASARHELHDVRLHAGVSIRDQVQGVFDQLTWEGM